jgi:hypothetical protein
MKNYTILSLWFSLPALLLSIIAIVLIVSGSLSNFPKYLQETFPK